MAKKKTKMSLTSLAGLGAYTQRSIVLDRKGIPWVICPETGTVSLATIIMPSDGPAKQSAVKAKKRK